MNFHELGLSKAILRTLEAIGHTDPTPIQSQAIPVILEGKDVVGLAQTGTGKTAAFLLPLLQRHNRPNHQGKFRPIRTVIITPTRELAAQIHEKALQYGKSLNLRSQCTVGGTAIAKQQHKLQRGADVLIATPGRLLDLAKRGAVSFDFVDSLVLDEADHMLDIGFLPDVKRIIALLPDDRQTLLFSATMPKQIQELASEYLKQPVSISVARTASVADKIEQLVKFVEPRQKHNELVELIKKHDQKKIVVFARTKHGSNKIVTRLKSVEIDAAAIHGNKTQGQRERALKNFSEGKILVLVATDIAARGIDIKDVGLVVNYELPNVPEVYVHRIGRTARAGSSGFAVSLCASDEVKHLRGIERLIKQEIPTEGIAPEPANDQTANTKAQKARRRKNTKQTSGRSVQKAADVGADNETKSKSNGDKNGPSQKQRNRNAVNSDIAENKQTGKLRKRSPNKRKRKPNRSVFSKAL